jgi:chloride channel protein, CIC family
MATQGEDPPAGPVSAVRVDAGGPEDPDLAVSPSRPIHPYVHVVIVAIVGALAVLAWLIVFEEVNKLLWENDVVTSNPWLFPAICLPFSLAAGLLVKYRNAPTCLNESMLDSLSGDVSKIDWRTLPVNVVMAWVSLFSGAVLGPEGGIGGIASKLAALYNEKVGVPPELRPRLVFSTLASAYNGLLANPLFTGVLGSELMKDQEAKSRNLPANLIGGAIGYLVFFAVGSTGLQDFLHMASNQPLTLLDPLLVVVFGLVGLVLAIVSGALFRVAGAIFGRFAGREVERALLAGLIFSAVGMVAPILLFSGETQIQEIAADPGKYGAALLFAMALVKLALLAVAFKGGFLGGPTFPAIFASVCVALGIGLLFPGLRVDVVVGGVMAGFLLVLFKAPFMVILLTTVMLEASPELTALIILAVAAVMIAQPYAIAAIEAFRSGQAARRAARRHLA